MLLICPTCNCSFKRKPFIVKRQKTVCCSMSCSKAYRSLWFRGEGNHQKGVKGKDNSSFKADITVMKRGTQRYEFEYLPWHPFAESTGRVRRHRAEVERHFGLFDNKYFLSILCADLVQRAILNPKFDVHHINENTLDNRIENLEIKTRGEHTRAHNNRRTIQRDAKTGRIIGIIKSRELLENPEEGNQQPSVVNDIEVATKVQRLGGEESTNNPSTSARHSPANCDDIV